MASIKKIDGSTGTTYKITVSCGYTSTGAQKRYYKTWNPAPGMTARQIQKEVQRQAVIFEEECKAGNVADSNIKFQAFAEQWFKEYADTKLKARTVEGYHKQEKRVYAAIGHVKIGAVTTRMLQKFVLNLQEGGINERTGGALSPKTIKNIMSFVSSIFNYAISQGMIRNNPCRGLTLPPVPAKERDCYSLEETQQFLDLLEQEPLHWRVFFVLAVYGGFRRGELLGLEWSDIDLDNNLISINRTSLYTKEKGVFTDTPKTKGSVRVLHLPDSVMQLLKQYKTSQALEQLRLGGEWINSNRLFVGWNGKPINPNTPQGWLHDFLARVGLRQINIHSFRHLNASLLINSGADVRTVSAALGHSQASTTLNIYAHAFAAAQAKSTEAIANALETHKKKP